MLKTLSESEWFLRYECCKIYEVHIEIDVTEKKIENTGFGTYPSWIVIFLLKLKGFLFG